MTIEYLNIIRHGKKSVYHVYPILKGMDITCPECGKHISEHYLGFTVIDTLGNYFDLKCGSCKCIFRIKLEEE